MTRFLFGRFWFHEPIQLATTADESSTNKYIKTTNTTINTLKPHKHYIKYIHYVNIISLMFLYNK